MTPVNRLPVEDQLPPRTSPPPSHGGPKVMPLPSSKASASVSADGTVLATDTLTRAELAGEVLGEWARAREADRAWRAVACPVCGALAGEECLARTRGRRRAGVHSRWLLAARAGAGRRT